MVEEKLWTCGACYKKVPGRVCLTCGKKKPKEEKEESENNLTPAQKGRIKEATDDKDSDEEEDGDNDSMNLSDSEDEAEEEQRDEHPDLPSLKEALKTAEKNGLPTSVLDEFKKSIRDK